MSLYHHAWVITAETPSFTQQDPHASLDLGGHFYPDDLPPDIPMMINIRGKYHIHVCRALLPPVLSFLVITNNYNKS